MQMKYLQCHICGRRFRHKGHLTRHLTSHTSDKSHQCAQCGKFFARKDTLQRHEVLHRQGTGGAGQEYFPKACQQCAESKSRCSKTLPCSRCTGKSLACDYAEQQASGTNITIESDQATRTVPEELLAEQGPMEVLEGISSPNPRQTCLPDQHQILDRISNENGYLLNTDTSSLIMQAADLPANDINTGLRSTSFDLSQMTTGSYIKAGMNWWIPEMPEFDPDVCTQIVTSNWHTGDFGFAEEIAQYHGSQTMTSAIPQPFREVTRLQGTPSSLTNQRMHPETPQSDSSFAETLRCVADDLKSQRAAERADDGRYYADGTAGRIALPGIQERLLGRILSAPSRPFVERIGNYDPGTGTRQQAGNLSPPEPNRYHLAVNLYATLLRGLCDTLGPNFIPAEIENFPSSTDVDLFVQSYFKLFHITFPFVRRSDFSSANVPWLLILGVAAVGAHITRSSRASYLHALLSEVLNSRTSTLGQTNQITNLGMPHANCGTLPAGISTVQARVLNLMLMLNFGSVDGVDSALMERACLVERCEAMGLLGGHSRASNQVSDGDEGAEIQEWTDSETRLRIGLMIWILDTMLAYQADSTFRLSFLGPTVRLPSTEAEWESPLPCHLRQKRSRTGYIMGALEHIWIYKELPVQMSHFSYTLLVHAIYRRVRDITSQTHGGFFNFVPSASPSTEADGAARSSGITSTEGILSKWRNSACDSLDVLHWQMNAEIAGCAGWEHPCVMFLHLSRLLILSPVLPLQILAGDPQLPKYRSADHEIFSHDEISDARTRVVRWALKDCFKARLCLVHAGALYWHVRRYGSGGISEPFGIYVATLVLWAYSTVTRVLGTTASDQSSSDREDVDVNADPLRQAQTRKESGKTDTELPFIYLDRPCDDELVQHFVRDDRLTTAYVQGVGDIKKPGAAKKILRVGQRLLEARNGGHNPKTLSGEFPEAKSLTWEVEKRYIASLGRLNV